MIAANLVPVFGVLFLGWDVATILLLYWLESVVIGVLTLPKILTAQGNIFSKVFNSFFFTVHFGGFCFGHMIFLVEFLDIDIAITDIMSLSPITIAALSLFISHLISLIVNFYIRGEYREKKSNEVMFAPYGRVILMHVTIILGGALAQRFGAPVYALVFLVVLKTVIDVMAHTKEHRSLDTEIRP